MLANSNIACHSPASSGGHMQCVVRVHIVFRLHLGCYLRGTRGIVCGGGCRQTAMQVWKRFPQL